MKVNIIEQSEHTDTLISRGSISSTADEGQVELYGRKISISGKEEINTGLFECSAGSYRRSVKQAEIMHILKGSGSFTEDGKETVFFKSGDTLFFSENTEGDWVIDTVMRKMYVIIPS